MVVSEFGIRTRDHKLWTSRELIDEIFFRGNFLWQTVAKALSVSTYASREKAVCVCVHVLSFACYTRLLTNDTGLCTLLLLFAFCCSFLYHSIRNLQAFTRSPADSFTALRWSEMVAKAVREVENQVRVN